MSESNAPDGVAQALPSTEVELGGAKRTLKYGLRALAELQKVTGRNPFSPELLENIDPPTLAALIWAGLLHAEPKLLLDEVYNWIESLYQAARLIEPIAAALNLGMPKPETAPAPAPEGEKKTPTESSETTLAAQ